MGSNLGGHLPVAADSNDAIHYEIVNGTLTEQYRLNAIQVVGEISSIQLGQVNAICLPQNRADAHGTLDMVPIKASNGFLIKPVM